MRDKTMQEYLGDILVYDKKRQLALIVVSTNLRNKSSQWVMQFRRNLYQNSALPKTPFFVMAFPDHFYLWKNVEDKSEVEPTYEMEPRFTLQSVVKKSGLSVDNLERDSFELLINFWFTALQLASEEKDICLRHPNWQLAPNHTWLFDSGLFEAVKGGNLITRYEYDEDLC
jgi:hypothetical protein